MLPSVVFQSMAIGTRQHCYNIYLNCIYQLNNIYHVSFTFNNGNIFNNKHILQEEWAVQNVASTHIAAHPENARFMHVLRNIIGVTGCKMSGSIVNCVLQKYQ